MKKIYLSICALFVVFTSFAQITNLELIPSKGEKLSSDVFISNSKANPFWDEDFANGIPSTWTNSMAPWVYRGIGQTGIGSQGAYGTNSGAISSATQTNGFIIFDSDYYDNGGTAGAFGTGMYPCPHNGMLRTENIDFSAYSDITLQFHSYFRTFAGQAWVYFYVNGALSGQVQVHTDIDVNESTATDAIALVRVPSNVCGNNNVQMEFVFEGTTNALNGFNGYYFWMIDDLELMETPDYLMDIIDVNHGGWNIGYASTTGFGMDYTFKPIKQSNANPYMFELQAANVGAQSLYGIQMHIEVLDGIMGTQVFSSSSDTTTLVVLDTAIYMANQNFTPATPGVYDMRFWASSDQLPSSATSDTSYMQAIITDTVYGRDYGNGGSSGWRVARDCGGLQLGNIFDIYATDTLTSVSAYLQDYSVPGTNMYGVIYEVDTTTSPWGFIMWDQTSDYTIQQQDPDSWVTIMFDDPIELYPGPWMIAIGSYAHPLDTFGISTSGNAEVGMSRIQDNGCNLGSQSFGYWYWVSSTPMIRMNFGGSTSPPPPPASWDCINNTCIDPGTGNGQYNSLAQCMAVCVNTGIEESNSTINIYPNPTKGNLNLTFPESKEYTIDIKNLLGEKIYSNKVSGSLQHTINFSNYNKGIYLITVSDGETVHTDKIIFK
ncbi:MAG: T9SS type A sorting domain-containing protein [Bacteroidota bacterium]|nr:T9SS type A sorting domain-containing protein [Bacteroidota bacterium]